MAPSAQQSILTREFLIEIAGWRTFQEGKVLFEGSKVVSHSLEGSLLSGVVYAGTSTVNARLKLGKRVADTENLCSCRQAREYGTICPHVIALGLSAIKLNGNGSHSLLATKSHSIKGNAPAENSQLKIPKLLCVSTAEAQPGMKHLEIRVLLPLEFRQSWKSGEMRIMLEALVDGGDPVMLDAVSRDQTYSVFDSDYKLLQAVEEVCQGEAPGMFSLKSDRFTDFFSSLVDHSNIWLGKKSQINVLRAGQPLKIQLDMLPNGDIRIHLEAPAQTQGEIFYAPGSAWRFYDEKLELLGVLPPAYRLLKEGDVVLPRNAVGRFFQQELPLLERQMNVITSENCRNLRFQRIEPHIRVTLDGLLMGLNCKMEAVYGNTSYPLQALSGGNGRLALDWIPDPTDPANYFARDDAAERAAQKELILCGFQPGQRNTELYTLASEPKVGAFLANVLPRWQAKWEVVTSSRMADFVAKCDFIQPEVRISSSGQDWLSIDVDFRSTSGFVNLSRTEVQTLLQKGVSHYRSPNGRIALLPAQSVQQFQEVLFDCHVQADGTGWKADRRHASYITGVLRQENWKITSPEELAEREFQSFAEIEPPEQVRATLRVYQKTGVSWLHYLAQNQLGGILADEMGLGKTLQTLTFLQHRKNLKLSVGPTLIICPTSLVFNWLTEARRFTPNLSVLVLSGSGRKDFFSKLENYDVVITSYALLRRDIAELQKAQFDCVILDEAQNIKNRASQNAQSAKALNAKCQLVLTGTPIENSLFDLWSIFDFLMPNYLGPASEFRERYELPITKTGDAPTLARLRQRIQPFVLRRTKAEVASDLPAKLEEITYCDLTDEQKSVYQAILEQSRREVFEHTGKQGDGRDKLAVLTALTRLRQVCCHLKLLPGIEKEWGDPSTKMNYFFEVLDAIISGNHRVLVFSQFVSLLRLIEEEIKSRKIDYCYLDGATVDRQAQIERFQNNSNIPIFLISLKAGGTGLNLTEADTVIHFDPWWNPAVEDQATARAHRMGQSRVVTSYKLIARGTVEEKIIQLQQKKKEIISSTIVNEEAFIHSLTMEDLQHLLD